MRLLDVSATYKFEEPSRKFFAPFPAKDTLLAKRGYLPITGIWSNQNRKSMAIAHVLKA